MNKKELVELLESLEIPCNEGIQHMNDTDKLPRIVYFEYIWEPIGASGNEYDTLVRYQISFFSLIPRDPKLILLKKLLNKKDIMAAITHEYIEIQENFILFLQLM